jgi:hypothetical protein
MISKVVISQTSPASAVQMPPARSAGSFAATMPNIQRQILAHLATKPTNARGYAAIQLAGYSVDALDDAIGALYHDGLLNAFFIARTGRPRYHPSSLTPEGRRVFERLALSSAA